MDFAFHSGEAGRINGQAFEPLGLTFGQHPPRLAATSAGEEALRPCGRPRFCFGLSRPMGGSSQSRCTSIPRPPPRATSIPVAPPRSHRQVADQHTVAPDHLCPRRRLPASCTFGRNDTTFDLTVYASQDGSPHHHARLASGCWSSFARRDSYPQGFSERFQSSSVFLLPKAYLTQGHHT